MWDLAVGLVGGTWDLTVGLGGGTCRWDLGLDVGLSPKNALFSRSHEIQLKFDVIQLKRSSGAQWTVIRVDLSSGAKLSISSNGRRTRAARARNCVSDNGPLADAQEIHERNATPPPSPTPPSSFIHCESQ